MMQYHQHYNNITAHAAVLVRCQLRAGEIIENWAWCARCSLGSDKWAPTAHNDPTSAAALLITITAAGSNKLLFYGVWIHRLLCRTCLRLVSWNSFTLCCDCSPQCQLSASITVVELFTHRHNVILQVSLTICALVAKRYCVIFRC